MLSLADMIEDLRIGLIISYYIQVPRKASKVKNSNRTVNEHTWTSGEH